MGRRFRLMLMGILAVALPLQGVSAMTLSACAGDHPSHFGARAPSHSDDEDGGTRHAHLQGADVSVHAHAASADPDQDIADAAAGAAHKCSACAACCLNAAVLTAPVPFGTVDLPCLFASLVTRPPAAYVTEGPERPPRTFLA